MFRKRPVPYIPCPRKTPTTTENKDKIVPEHSNSTWHLSQQFPVSISSPFVLIREVLEIQSYSSKAE